MRERLWLNGKWKETSQTQLVVSPYSGDTVATVDLASEEDVKEALNAGAQAAKPFSKVSRFMRSRLLKFMAEEIERRRSDLVSSIIKEAGKPRTFAEIEVTRAVTTFTLGAEESKRYGGEFIPMDIDAGGRAFESAVSYFTPRGLILAIAPFNFPLNLVAHKLVPAIAVGAPVIIKPPPQAPGASVILAEIFEKGLEAIMDPADPIPPAAVQVIHCSNELASSMAKDARVSIVSFTGSAKVGWMLQNLAIGKRVLLELGGNAAVIVHSDADIERAAARCVVGAYSYSGQVCISVQRIFVHSSIYEAFKKKFVEKTEKTAYGDPDDISVIAGPIIDSGARDRLNSWIEEAKGEGGKLLCGGTCDKNVMIPAVMESVPRHLNLSCEEAFGPVAVLESYDNFSDAVDGVNDSRYGLQAGLFTNDNRIIQEGVENLDVGGIIINEVPTFRADHMPYGGVKESGLGREGVKYTMEEFSERKTVVRWRG